MKLSDVPQELLALHFKRIKYPSPFLDLATLTLDISKKELDKLCFLISVLDPIVGPIIRKLAKYAITQILVDTTDEQLKDSLEKFINKISLQNHLIQIGIDYHTYGNAFVSILYPFVREFICQGCKNSIAIEDIKQIGQLRVIENDIYFIGLCPKCQVKRQFLIKTIKNLKLSLEKFNNEIQINHWPTTNIEIEYIPAVNFAVYYYSLSKNEVNMVRQCNINALKFLPEQFIKAAIKGTKLEITTFNMFHFKFPTPTSADFFPGWGISPIVNVIKLIYYTQILRKSNEVIAWEHILPLRILTPNPQFGPVKFDEFAKRVSDLVKRWKLDPGAIGILPTPILSTLIGGEGKALNLTPEIVNAIEQIITGMEVPRELVYGGLSWSSSLVALRMLENYFMNYTYQLQHFFDFFIEHVKKIYDLKTPISLRFKTFRRADDIQYLNLLIGLSQAQFISKETLMDIMGFDYAKEREKIQKEMEALIEDTSLLDEKQKKKQLEIIDKLVDSLIAQWLTMAAREAGYTLLDIERLIDYWTYQLLSLPEDQQQQTLESLKEIMPHVYEAILTKLTGLKQVIGEDRQDLLAERIEQAKREERLEEIRKKEEEKRKRAMKKPLSEQKPPRREYQV